MTFCGVRSVWSVLATVEYSILGGNTKFAEPDCKDALMKKYVHWLVLVLLVSFVGGIALDVNGFAVNLLASAIATVAGVWVAVNVIESILRQQRYEEWRFVRLRFYRVLIQEIISLALQFNLLLTHTSYLSEILSMNDDTTIASTQTLNKLLTSLRSMDSMPNRAQLDLLYKRCNPHLHRIRDIILPLVVSAGQELQLIEALQEFEQAATQWEHDQLDVEPGISTEHLFKDALETLASLDTLYASLCSASR